jgi:hypothetical protein
MRVPRWAQRAALALVGLAVLVPAIGFAYLRWALGPSPMARCAGHSRFDPAAWRDSALVAPPLSVRGCMVDDLLATHALPGQTRDEIVRLLGAPPPSAFAQPGTLTYRLGPERSPLGVDSEWLILELDAQQRVRVARLATD